MAVCDFLLKWRCPRHPQSKNLCCPKIPYCVCWTHRHSVILAAGEGVVTKPATAMDPCIRAVADSSVATLTGMLTPRAPAISRQWPAAENVLAFSSRVGKP